MTVLQLIRKLNEFPLDATVLVRYETHATRHIEKVSLLNDPGIVEIEAENT
jgi:hypothetical protein